MINCKICSESFADEVKLLHHFEVDHHCFDLFDSIEKINEHAKIQHDIELDPLFFEKIKKTADPTKKMRLPATDVIESFQE